MSLRVELQSSRLLCAIELAQFAIAIVAVFLLARSYPLALVLLIPIVVSAHQCSKRPQMPRAVYMIADEWHLVFDERVAHATLRRECHCTPWLHILEFEIQEDGYCVAEKVWIILLPDSASCEDRRRLSVFMRWYHFAPQTINS